MFFKYLVTPFISTIPPIRNTNIINSDNYIYICINFCPIFSGYVCACSTTVIYGKHGIWMTSLNFDESVSFNFAPIHFGKGLNPSFPLLYGFNIRINQDLLPFMSTRSILISKQVSRTLIPIEFSCSTHIQGCYGCSNMICHYYLNGLRAFWSRECSLSLPTFLSLCSSHLFISLLIYTGCKHINQSVLSEILFKKNVF